MRKEQFVKNCKTIRHYKIVSSQTQVIIIGPPRNLDLKCQVEPDFFGTQVDNDRSLQLDSIDTNIPTLLLSNNINKMTHLPSNNGIPKSIRIYSTRGGLECTGLAHAQVTIITSITILIQCLGPKGPVDGAGGPGVEPPEKF